MLKFLLLLCTGLLFITTHAHACTGIVRKAENGDVVYARTMEFGADLISYDLTFVPRGISYTAQTPSGIPGAKWTVQYAHIGFNPFGMPVLIDGLNEKGLACGGFYFPGWAEYEQIPENELSKSISNIDFVSWVLGNFSRVEEVREALQKTKVTGVVLKECGFIPGIHYIVVDSSGHKVVVEYVKGKLNIYEAPLATITNAPTYDWHMINARNYIGLRALNKPSVKIEGKEFSQFGQGSGALGLPGDFTPPSRFIRAAFLCQAVLSGKTGWEEVFIAFHILNQFDIPLGAVRANENGKTVYEKTQWTSISDLAGLRYFFRTYENSRIRAVDLNKLDLQTKQIKSFPINSPEKIEDLSNAIH